MFSTRKCLNRNAPARRRTGAQLALALAAGSALAAGCQRAPKPAPEPVSTSPMVVDEAMQYRDWPRATAYFQAGGVDAGATRFPYNPQTTGDGAGRATLGPERRNSLLDTAAFVVQVAKLPFTYVRQPPFVDKNYRGVMYDPTYTAMPVLPPDEAPVEEGEEPTSPPLPAPVPTDDAVQDAVNTVTTPSSEQPTVAPGEVPPGQDPPEAQPPVITPDSSLPAPAEPTGPAPEDGAPAPAPEATEPAPEPAPEVTEPAPVEPAPAETTEPAPEPTPEPAPEPAPEAPAEDDLNK
jgi:hypothetical protein